MAKALPFIKPKLWSINWMQLSICFENRHLCNSGNVCCNSNDDFFQKAVTIRTPNKIFVPLRHGQGLSHGTEFHANEGDFARYHLRETVSAAAEQLTQMQTVLCSSTKRSCSRCELRSSSCSSFERPCQMQRTSERVIVGPANVSRHASAVCAKPAATMKSLEALRGSRLHWYAFTNYVISVSSTEQCSGRCKIKALH